MIVKVQLREPGAGAVIYSEDRKVVDSVPTNLVTRRFARGEHAGYFNATFEHEILELGDRVPDPVPAW